MLHARDQTKENINHGIQSENLCVLKLSSWRNLRIVYLFDCVADPGSFAFLTPGSWIRDSGWKIPDLGYGIRDQEEISWIIIPRTYLKFLGKKYFNSLLRIHQGSGIQCLFDPGSRIWERNIRIRIRNIAVWISVHSHWSRTECVSNNPPLTHLGLGISDKKIIPRKTE